MTQGYEAWEVQTFTGIGRSVVRIEPVDRAVLVIFQTGEGRGNSMLEAVDASGSTTWWAVNELGRYTGINLFSGERGPVVAFKITSEVGWSLAIRPLSDARTWSESEVSGDGDDVLVLPDSGRGFSTVALRATVRGNTQVWAYGNDSSHLLFNGIGAIQEETILPGDAWIVSIKSNGPWTMARG